VITYDRRAFVEAYLDAHPKSQRGHYASNAHSAALREHQLRVLGGLQELFGVVLEAGSFPQEHVGLFVLFRGTASSLLAITSPGEGAAEAGLLYRQLAAAGVDEQVQAGLGRIIECNEQSRAAHLDVMETLLAVLLGDRADATFTSADLAAVGVDDTAGPNPADYDLWEDY
jgi:hypothetical protein